MSAAELCKKSQTMSKGPAQHSTADAPSVRLVTSPVSLCHACRARHLTRLTHYPDFAIALEVSVSELVGMDLYACYPLLVLFCRLSFHLFLLSLSQRTPNDAASSSTLRPLSDYRIPYISPPSDVAFSPFPLRPYDAARSVAGRTPYSLHPPFPPFLP